MASDELRQTVQPDEPRIPFPDPTPAMLTDPLFNAIWQTIKHWDVNVPNVYVGYCGAYGNHARAIFDAIARIHAPITEAVDIGRASESIAGMVADWYGNAPLPNARITAEVIAQRLARFVIPAHPLPQGEAEPAALRLLEDAAYIESYSGFVGNSDYIAGNMREAAKALASLRAERDEIDTERANWKRWTAEAESSLAAEKQRVVGLENAEEQLAIRAGAWKQQSAIMGERVAALEGALTEAGTFMLTAFKRMRAAHVSCQDMASEFETWLQKRALCPAETGEPT